MNGLLHTFGQTYTTFSDPSLTTSTTPSGLGPVFLVFMLVILVLCVVMIASLWKIFTKAGKPGWAAIVPIYNLVVELEIVGRPVWWVALFFASIIPFVGSVVTLVVSIIVANDLSKSFGKSTGFTVLLVLLPFIGYPMLAWGDATYHGPSVTGGAGAAPMPGAGMPPAPTPPSVPPTMPQ